MMTNQVFIGQDALDGLCTFFEQSSFRKVFLVRGKNSYQICGAKQMMDAIFNRYFCSVTDFFDFEENPKLGDMQRGVEAFEKCGADVLIAIGGGSVLDMGKLIRFFYAYEGEPTGKNFVKKNDIIPLIALPTTAGTGSEVTRFAVLYKDAVKYSVEHEIMRPDMAVIYPPFTYGIPKYITACTGFDALAQGIEAFWNVHASKESDNYAGRAIQCLWRNLPKVVNAPNDSIRDMVTEGAYWAGCAINITKTTAPHAFSYAFTTYCGLPHGHAVAQTFPFFAALNCLDLGVIELQSGMDIERYKYKIDVLKNLLGIEEGQDIKKVFEDYLSVIGLRKQICPDIMNLLDLVNMQRLNNNPVKITNEIKMLLRNYF